MKPEGYRYRYAERDVDLLMQGSGAVCIEGPKWCGKTWTALSRAKSAMMVADPEKNFQNRRLIGLDVREALKGEAPHLIDEWQEFPAIWDAVRMEVDRSAARGRFILTGSSTPEFKGVAHSGTGRIDSIRMRTMSLHESGDSDGRVSLSSLFGNGFEVSPSARDVSLDELIGMTVRGGWPGNMGTDPDVAMMHNAAYLDRVLEDAHRLVTSEHMGGEGRRVRNAGPSKRKMRMTVRSLARNESTFVAETTLARDTREFGEKVDVQTVRRHIDLLDRLYLIEDQPAFDPNYRSERRVGKAPKRHLADPSLAVAAMGLTPAMLRDDLQTYGFMFEAMCERDLDIYARANGGRLFHYRDHQGKEVDAVVEMPDGRWGAFEIKLGANQVDAAAESLLDVRDVMESREASRAPSVLAVVCGMEASAYRRRDGVYVLPITGLGA